tara:strand:- start:139 stop:1473 length:1335 start_codon:yes stop_codon:yes gene_type:complete
MLTIKNPNIIQFYRKNNISFEEDIELWLSIRTHIMKTLGENIDNGKNTLILEKLLNEWREFKSQQNKLGDKVYSDLSKLITSNVQQIRDICDIHDKKVQEEFKENIIKNNNNILDKINPIIRYIVEDEVNKISDIIKEAKNNDMNQISQIVEPKYNYISEKLYEISQKNNAVDLYFERQLCSSTKGDDGEKKLEPILHKTFPNFSIDKTASISHSGDFIISKKDLKILIDTKDYKTNIPKKEIKKIADDMDYNDCHGILVSNNSGISEKDDFQINIHNQDKIIIFLHNVNYSGVKIKAAVNMIEFLDEHFFEDGSDFLEKNETKVSLEFIKNINEEYKKFYKNKEKIINDMKNFHRDIIKEMEDLLFPQLSSFLSNKFEDTKKTERICEYCNVFKWVNARSMAAHQRSCKKKFLNNENKNNCVVIDTKQPEEELQQNKIVHTNA